MIINGIEVVSNGYFAYDGCHKIYILENEKDLKESIGYKIYPIKDLEEIYYNSCDLRFISSWALDKTYIEQCNNEHGECVNIYYTRPPFKSLYVKTRLQ